MTTHYVNDAKVEADFVQFGYGDLYGVANGGSIVFTVADENPVAFNPMAAGTVISAAATDGLAVSVAGGSPVPNSSKPHQAGINYKFDDKTRSGTITVTFRSPSGLGTSIAQDISMDAMPNGHARCSN